MNFFPRMSLSSFDQIFSYLDRCRKFWLFGIRFSRNRFSVVHGYMIFRISSADRISVQRFSIYIKNLMGSSGLEPPTSRLSGVRSNRLSYEPRRKILRIYLFKYSFFKSGGHLFSHIVSNIVPSAGQVLTVVFGMRTGVTPNRIATGKISSPLMTQH